MNNEAINTPTDSIFNDLEAVMESEIATPLIARLDYETPVTVNALAKISGLSQTALTLVLVVPRQRSLLDWRPAVTL